MVATIAHDKGFEEFLPMCQVRRRWSDRLKSIELPLFPGYVFCRLAPQHRLPLLMIPGVLHFVGIGKIPVPVADAEISAIRMAVQSGLSTEPWTFLKVGQRIGIHDGPLAGLEGILVANDKQQRLVVSVTLLERSIAVAIESHWARSLDSKPSENGVAVKVLA